MWLIVVIFLIVLGGISYGIATFWQYLQDGSKEKIATDQSVAVAADVLPLAQEEELVDPEEEISVEIEQEEEPVGTYLRRPEFPDAVMETEGYQPHSYFDDAIFFGDSISTGIAPYMEAVLPDVAVVAATGINVHSASTSTQFTVNETPMTMLEAANAEFGPRSKVYIMLGSNGLDTEKEAFIEGYSQFVRLVKAQYPGATIYLQSMPPVTGTPAQQESYPSLNNEKITEYNQAIMELAKKEGVYYLDVAVAFLNEDGILPVEASPDGVHFISEYYYKWFDYLRKHTVD